MATPVEESVKDAPPGKKSKKTKNQGTLVKNYFGNTHVQDILFKNNILFTDMFTSADKREIRGPFTLPEQLV